VDAATLFELELVRRGMRFTTEANSGRYLITVAGQPMAVDLRNLRRTLTGGVNDTLVVAGSSLRERYPANLVTSNAAMPSSNASTSWAS